MLLRSGYFYPVEEEDDATVYESECDSEDLLYITVELTVEVSYE